MLREVEAGLDDLDVRAGLRARTTYRDSRRCCQEQKTNRERETETPKERGGPGPSLHGSRTILPWLWRAASSL